ncbi:squalene/phytoene synthase family protein [Pseudooceanicola sp. CBS1P-1]|uniref:Phytoene synthase n=2 Tax=Paracoccaceae TaxID=31989 RepID=A0A6L7GB11_9RHOB|nr:squalene/phytoene synthase family protein [Pseudooceanicola endophyticus]MXN20872.1 phytoene synthase [Pseudooceanicola albus]
MAAPVPARAVLFPLYAFNIEVSRAPWVTQEPMIAEMRLQWWRDALEEIGQGSGIRRHEVVTPLALHLDATGAHLLDRLIVARIWDVWKDPFEDEAAFRDYLDATSGHLLRAGAGMLRADLPEAQARQAGFVLGLANWFRAVPALEGSGRQPLVDGREGHVAELAQEALAALKDLRAARGQVDRAAAPLMFGLPMAEAVLKLVVRTPARVKDGALEVAPFAQKLGLLKAGAFGRW